MRLPPLCACLVALLTALTRLSAQVVINEIHYQPVENPHFSTTGVPTFSDTNLPADLSDDVHEFLELLNSGPSAVDLTGWAFTAGVDYTFPANTTLPAGGYLVIAKNPARVALVYGLPAASILGPFLNGSKLSNSGDTVTLKDAAPAIVIDTVTYSPSFPWAISAAGLGADGDFTGLNSNLYQCTRAARCSGSARPPLPMIRPTGWRCGQPLAPLLWPISPHPGRQTSSLAMSPNRWSPPTRLFRRRTTRPLFASRRARSKSPVRFPAPMPPLSNVQVEYFLDNLNAFGETRNLVTMTALANGQYTATIPGQASRSILRYRIRADRGDGSEVVAPRADDPAVVPVGPPSHIRLPRAAKCTALKVAGAREPWYAYFVTPVRSSAKPIIDLMVSTDGSVVDDIATDNTVQFNGLNGFQAMAFDCKGSPKRTTAENTASSYPRETPYVRASDRIWEDVVPAVFATNGVIRDIQIRFHRSRYNRNPSSQVVQGL